MSREWREGRRVIVWQSARIALVVGPILVVVNNYDYVLRMAVPEHFWLKAVSTFVVPFLVSLYSAARYASRGRVRGGNGEHRVGDEGSRNAPDLTSV